MADTTVRDADIDDVIRLLRTGKEDVATKLREMMTSVQGLVDGGFVTPSASEAFRVAYENYTQGTTEAVEGVEGMASFLESAKQAYGTTDSDLASQIRQ